jgi:hypothetical protein
MHLTSVHFALSYYIEQMCIPPGAMIGDGLAIRLPSRLRSSAEAAAALGGSTAAGIVGAEPFLAVGNAGKAGFSFSFLISLTQQTECVTHQLESFTPMINDTDQIRFVKTRTICKRNFMNYYEVYQ